MKVRVLLGDVQKQIDSIIATTRRPHEFDGSKTYLEVEGEIKEEPKQKKLVSPTQLPMAFKTHYLPSPARIVIKNAKFKLNSYNIQDGSEIEGDLYFETEEEHGKD